IPTARQPLILAIWPTTIPVAPAAPETTTVSPARGLPISSNPKYAVSPVIPSAPRYTGNGAMLGSIFVSPRPSEMAYSCTPSTPKTYSPVVNDGFCDATTQPTAPARITSPIFTGSMYDRPSFIQPR